MSRLPSHTPPDEEGSGSHAHLRRRAVERLGQSPAAPAPKAPVESLAAELQIHQVELELQNRELREAQVQLEQARNRYFGLFDLSPVSYFVFDRNQHIQELNLAAAELIEAERQRAKHISFLLLVAEEHRAVFQRHLREVWTDPRKHSVELSLHLPSKRVRHVLLESLQVPGENLASTVCLTVCLDVTDRRLAEERRLEVERKLLESQKLESIGVLAGGIAHDFNNLLTGILGNLSLVRMQLPKEADVQRLLNQIEQCSRRAADLCQQMLAYAGRGQMVKAPFELSQLVQQTVRFVRASVLGPVKVEFQLTEPVPLVQGDATQIGQVIVGLLTNAREAIGYRDGHITVATGVIAGPEVTWDHAALKPEPVEPRYAFLEVRDNGCGIARDAIARIFEPFYSTKFTGRGLGLAAALGIVRGHRGGVRVLSQPNEGASFTVYLPCADTAIARAGSAAPPSNETWCGSGRVLVAEDEEFVRNLMSRLLRTLGFDVTATVDGREVVDRYVAEPDTWRLIMLDLTMPNVDGISACRELRRRGCKLPIVLMSGFSEQDVVSRLNDAGPIAFLQKPFGPAELRDRIRALLEATPAT